MLPSMTGPAETVAKLLVEGGDFYIASVRPDFMSEGTTRSGGFMFLKNYEPAIKLSERDAVIVAWTNTSPAEDLDLITRLHASGAFVVGIGPAPSADKAKEFLGLTSTFIDTSLPLPGTVTAPFKDEAYPVISLQNLALLWTFSGEIVSALTRLDHMPTMYQSVLVPGARQRNTRLKGMRFHEKGTVSPVAPTKLGKAYLQELASSFQSLRDGESDVIPFERDDAFFRQANGFLDVIEGRAAPACSLEEGAQTLRTILAILESTERRGWVAVANR